MSETRESYTTELDYPEDHAVSKGRLRQRGSHKLPPRESKLGVSGKKAYGKALLRKLIPRPLKIKKGKDEEAGDLDISLPDVPLRDLYEELPSPLPSPSEAEPSIVPERQHQHDERSSWLPLGLHHLEMPPNRETSEIENFTMAEARKSQRLVSASGGQCRSSTEPSVTGSCVEGADDGPGPGGPNQSTEDLQVLLASVEGVSKSPQHENLDATFHEHGDEFSLASNHHSGQHINNLPLATQQTRTSPSTPYGSYLAAKHFTGSIPAKASDKGNTTVLHLDSPGDLHYLRQSHSSLVAFHRPRRHLRRFLAGSVYPRCRCLHCRFCGRGT